MAERDYPMMAAQAGRVEPAPRRVRATLGGRTVFDSTRAHYVWEWPYYPQYYIPIEDVDADLLVDEDREQHLRFGAARRHGLRVGDQHRPASVRVYGSDSPAGIATAARFDWDALDAWYEEDEQIFVHPRNPFVRVDALRSRRHLRIELDGLVLGETDAPVMVFETGLPTRYYLDQTDVAFEHLVPSDTQTACPYKGVTSSYWSVRTGEALHDDLAWSYDFPTPALSPIAGLIAFYDEKVDVVLDGRLRARPKTHFFA